MQSYGERVSGTRYRSTNTEPTQSAVTGLIANALGYDRREDADRIAELARSFGLYVRVDRAGTLVSDFHTVYDASLAKESDRTVVTERHYLADAAFLVLVEFEDEDLATASAAALRAPKGTLYLGRMSAIPETPLVLGVYDADPEELASWMGSVADGAPSVDVQPSGPDDVAEERPFIRPAFPSEHAETVNDLPTGFRQFAGRRVVRTTITAPASPERVMPSDFRAGAFGAGRTSLADKMPVALVPSTVVLIDKERVSGPRALNRQTLHGYLGSRIENSYIASIRRGAPLALLIEGEHAPETFRGGAVAPARHEPVTAGERAKLRVMVNPTRQTSGGKRIGIEEPVEQVRWLLRRLENAGCSFVNARVKSTGEFRFSKRHQHDVTLRAADIEFEVDIHDAQAFENVVRGGIGRGRAYGLGYVYRAV